MAKNLVQKGSVLPVTAPEDLVSGQLFKVGSLVGVAMAAAKENDPVEMAVDRVWRVPKERDAITQGQVVYFKDSTNKVTTTASGNKKCGVAVVAASATARDVDVKLIQSI